MLKFSNAPLKGPLKNNYLQSITNKALLAQHVQFLNSMKHRFNTVHEFRQAKGDQLEEIFTDALMESPLFDQIATPNLSLESESIPGPVPTTTQRLRFISLLDAMLKFEMDKLYSQENYLNDQAKQFNLTEEIKEREDKIKEELNKPEPVDLDKELLEHMQRDDEKKKVAEKSPTPVEEEEEELQELALQIVEQKQGQTSKPTAAATVDLYKVLGVSHNASQADVKKAYKKAALRSHPDKNVGNEKTATKAFQAINDAYEILGNPEKRAAYDQTYPAPAASDQAANRASPSFTPSP